MLENCLEEIEMFEWKNWPNLEILEIRNCSVNSSMFDQFEGLGNLQEFSFTESNLESLEVSCSSLEKNKKINLSKNKFEALELSFLSTCSQETKHLILSENSFELFDMHQISGMKYLETLDLSKNKHLQSLIASSSHEKMASLSKIYLSSSGMLSKICNNVIYLVPNLEIFDVCNTSLQTVPSYLLRLEKLSQLKLEGTTPLGDCQLSTLTSSLQNRSSSGSDMQNYCKIPKIGEGFETANVMREDLSSSLNCDKVELSLEVENRTDISSNETRTDLKLPT